MTTKRILATLALGMLLLPSGCATKMSEAQQDAAITGTVVGTAGGAATGAIIGASISNGDVLASTGLGAGIGLGVGLVGGLMYHEVSLNNQISRNNDRIEANRQTILRTQKDLDEYREQLQSDTMSLEPDREKGEYRYEGPSLGNYNR